MAVGLNDRDAVKPHQMSFTAGATKLDDSRLSESFEQT